MSQPTGTVAVGVDGSESSLHALDWAVHQAVAEHRPITLVHGLGDPTPAWVELAVLDNEAAYAQMRSEARGVVDAARQRVEEIAPGIETHEIVEYVDPRELLLEQSKGAAMLVLGSRGRGTFRSALLGSVGVSLARHAKCPTVIHRPMNAAEGRRGIVVADDGTEESRPVLEFAYHQAALNDLPLTVLHCFWDYRAVTTAYYYDPGPSIDREAERLAVAETLAGMAEKYPDVRVTQTSVHGNPEVRLAMASDEHELVVVGAHQGSRLRQIMSGSVSVPVLEHATCPVAVVPVGATT